MQVFCRPVAWAGVAFAIAAALTVAAPVLHPRARWRVLVYVGYGLSTATWLYCALFLEWWPLLAIPLVFVFGLGALVAAPYYFVGYLLVAKLARAPDRASRGALVLGIGLAVAVASFAVRRYQGAERELRDAARADYAEFEPTFMTEKIVGIGLVYHTNVCGFDGWRPPLHEPFLNLGYWWGGRRDPLGELDLRARRRLYRRLFPEREAKQPCACAVQESAQYHGDALWGDRE